MATLSGSLAAFLASKRYDFLVVSYLATANRLQRLLDRWRTAGSPADPPRWSQFVDDCENAIAIENESWLAKWADAR
ncbi:SLATT domain-containing protein [Nocardia vinacea]|uniref:SLATT domain-containing protein n=1 Tax=Nocardia vinacea TaxID=96468 RepID=UPI0033D2A998